VNLLQNKESVQPLLGPGLLILLLAFFKLVAIFFLLGWINGGYSAPFDFDRQPSPGLSLSLGILFGLSSVFAWIALGYYFRQKQSHQNRPLQQIEEIGE
jgi:hypothetical protein